MNNNSEEFIVFSDDLSSEEKRTEFWKKYGLDVYFFNENDFDRYKYWKDLFTRDRDKNEKGCAVIQVNGGAL